MRQNSHYSIYMYSLTKGFRVSFSPGRGICMPGKGTLKGGTMTGGKAGMAAVGWATLWGRAAGSSGTVCTAVTGDGTVETVTTVTGETATDEVTVAIGGRSATTVAFGKKKKYFWFYSCFVCVCVSVRCWWGAVYLLCSQRGNGWWWSLDWRWVCGRGPRMELE